jgi:hypothetical protein
MFGSREEPFEGVSHDVTPFPTTVDGRAMMKRLLKSLLWHTPYRVGRATNKNRFQAIEGCLWASRSRGYSPKVIVDGGAHLGLFSLCAKVIWPNAWFHLVEPQPACQNRLKAICSAEAFTLHSCALAERTGELDLACGPEP